MSCTDGALTTPITYPGLPMLCLCKEDRPCTACRPVLCRNRSRMECTRCLPARCNRAYTSKQWLKQTLLATRCSVDRGHTSR